MSSGTLSEQEKQQREDLVRRREAVQIRQSQISTDERESQKRLHWMRCPKCGSELAEVQFRNVKVDKCFACNGVFLDDGELEQLTGKPGWIESMLRFFKS
ncbi:TFIIB-type zinc ribbon-containing protein [Nannocystis bainbridge]|uniref:Zf-TFIIB domain-containing protein n=1 Tax=Nannocystis bainbridge TaxID=2995303 RepID=A0ABT5DQ05_9BACT|nr:zf-TFIIB domain-containing protein [Nannocystis bainbridge]MDC0715735.1 zf-TFIIB domain-containing protein [Nannocystis bainbridge]